MTINSYSKIYNLGHRDVAEIFNEPVLVEEKIDGSQISFGVYEGLLKMRSRGAEINTHSPEGMFGKGVEVVRSIEHLLIPGFTYRGEYLQKPKHNTLAYDRVPHNHIMIFDIDAGLETYLTYDGKRREAARLGFETVPVIYEGVIASPADIKDFLERISILGGQKIEGVVAKNYQRTTIDKKTMMGKFVSEAFKEIHQGAWKEANPNAGDIVQKLIDAYRTPARWNKAIQHLQEAGTLTGTPKDIGPIIQEIKKDVFEEEGPAIADTILKWARPKIERGLVAGLPEFYKEQLLESQFATASN